MNLKKSKYYLLENTRKALAFVSVFSILFASGCTFGVPSGNDVPKDDYSNSHARIIEDNANSNIDNIDITKPEGTGEIDNENDPSQNAKIENDLGGFIIPTPGSFADRVQGLYKVEGEKDTYVEFYDIGDNIYGYYSGKQHGCIELFALDEEGFISTTSDSIEVQMPIEQTKLILLPVDAEFNMIVYTGAGLYQCFVRVIDRYKSNNIYVLVLELTSNLRKYQRREYYRFSCALEMCSSKHAVGNEHSAEELVLEGHPVECLLNLLVNLL